MNKIIKAILLLIIVVGLLAGGFYAGKYTEKQAGLKSEKQMFAEVFANVLPGNVLSGKVTGISGDKKSITVDVLSVMNINLPTNFRSKTVLINKDTKIVLITQKNPDEFNKEMSDFSIKMKNNFAIKPGTSSSIITPPNPFVQKDITVGDIKIGDKVNFSFISKQGQSVLDSQFEATQISVSK